MDDGIDLSETALSYVNEIASVAARLALANVTVPGEVGETSGRYKIEVERAVTDIGITRNWTKVNRKIERRLAERAALLDEIQSLRVQVQERAERRQLVEDALRRSHEEENVRARGDSALENSSRILNVATEQLQVYRTQLAKKEASYQKRIQTTSKLLASFEFDQYSHRALVQQNEEILEKQLKRDHLAKELAAYHDISVDVVQATHQIEAKRKELADLDATFQALVGNIQV